MNEESVVLALFPFGVGGGMIEAGRDDGSAVEDGGPRRGGSGGSGGNSSGRMSHNGGGTSRPAALVRRGVTPFRRGCLLEELKTDAGFPAGGRDERRCNSRSSAIR